MESIGNIILYFVVALIIAVFSVMTVTTRKILRAATYLLFVLLGTAVFYFQLGYEFLGAVQIAVYAGGILVLFVFSILLTQHPADPAAYLQAHRKFIGGIAAVSAAALMAVALFTFPLCDGVTLTEAIGGDIDMKEIGHYLLSSEKFGYLLPFEAISVLLLACIIGGITIARKK
ncbi:MAG: NADH-quinone oxidoreductase subunit J [Bacteroidales bacterium]|nr:NADH-quinone oxidoreductase subunit J [Bacteroidales bacterium]